MDATDEREFREFVAGRSTALLRLAHLLTGDAGHAEDLLQTALMRVYLAWPRITDRNAREAYVRRTLVREQVSWWRRLRNREIPHETFPESATVDFSRASDERDAVVRALATLSARQRAVIALRYYADLTEAQTADALGCAVGTVKSHTADALARLRADGALAPEGTRR